MTERPVRTEMPNSIELSVVNKFRREIWTKFLKGIKGEEMRRLLNEHGVCISVKSACSVPNTPSRAVMAISHDRKNALSSWHISLSHLTTEQEIEQFTAILDQIISEG